MGKTEGHTHACGIRGVARDVTFIKVQSPSENVKAATYPIQGEIGVEVVEARRFLKARYAQAQA